HFTFENTGGGPDEWPFDEPHYLILNLAIGGGWGGQEGIDDSIFPQQYVIDYVRSYQRIDCAATRPSPSTSGRFGANLRCIREILPRFAAEQPEGTEDVACGRASEQTVHHREPDAG